jgi:RNA polymerase sigma-70 factor (ECF subfamily)
MLESQSNRIELVESSGDPLHFRVQSALESLRFKDREVLILVYWDGLTHAEAAIVLGCSVNAVALRVKKAKSRLQSKISPLDVGEATRSSPPLLTPRKEHLP